MTEGSQPAEPGAPDEVPRLPRGRGLRLSRPQMVRIAGTLLLLVFIVLMQRPCSDSVSKFVTGFGSNGSAAPAMPRPGTVDMPAAGSGSATTSNHGADLPLDHYERLRPGMTDDELKAAVERARAKATEAGSAGAAAGSGAGSGP